MTTNSTATSTKAKRSSLPRMIATTGAVMMMMLTLRAATTTAVAVVEGFQMTTPSPQRRTRACASSTSPSLSSSFRRPFPKKHAGATTTTTQLRLSSSSSSNNDDNEGGGISFNAPYAAAWLGLVGWAFSSAAPGSLGSAQDTEMLNAILADPVHPPINALYYAVFNFFAVVPLLLSALVLPQSPANSKGKGGVPALPFLLASGGIGYFAIGPYLTFRAGPVRDYLAEKGPEGTGWFTRNVLENKFFAAFLLAFTVYLFVGGGVVQELQTDPSSLWQGFVDVATSSRFAAVSLVDLALLYASCVSVTPSDYLIRKPGASPEEAQRVAAATALMPFVGSLLYLLLRPNLPRDEQEASS